MANREIDFMAWNGRELYYPDSLLNNPLEVGYLDDSGCPKAQYGRPLIQYTGLKDKNGKKIYEGHIVKFGAQLGSVAEVKWLIKNAGFLVKDKWGDWQWLYDVVASTNCEIIGNIYENPDLLEAKDE